MPRSRCPKGTRRLLGNCVKYTRKSPKRKSSTPKSSIRKSSTRKSPKKSSEFYFETEKKRCPKGFIRSTYSQEDLGIVKGKTCVMNPKNPKYHEWDAQKEIKQKRNKQLYGDENFVNGTSTFGMDEIIRMNNIRPS